MRSAGVGLNSALSPTSPCKSCSRRRVKPSPAHNAMQQWVRGPVPSLTLSQITSSVKQKARKKSCESLFSLIVFITVEHPKQTSLATAKKQRSGESDDAIRTVLDAPCRLSFQRRTDSFSNATRNTSSGHLISITTWKAINHDVVAVVAVVVVATFDITNNYY